MLDFSDEPYQYFPSKRNALIAWIIGVFNRTRRLPNKLKVDSVEVSGNDTLISNINRSGRRRDRILFLPNHPTHADAAVFLEALRQAGFTTQMMAAYDVFLRGKLDAWVMQKMGAFSVDREGGDQQAMKDASAVLAKGKHALTIFPEGNVYLRNDRVTPFNDGAAFIAIRAAKELAKHDVRVVAVPVSIKLTHLTDCRSTLDQLLVDLAKSMAVPDVQHAPGQPPREAIVQIGRAAIRRNLQQRGLTPPDSDDLSELINYSAGAVLDDLEAKLEIRPKDGTSLVDRVRTARRLVHDVRTDDGRKVDHVVARTWADMVMLAFRIASYLPDYVVESPTLDRVSETVEKLAEDVHGEMIEPIGLRRAMVHFNQPILLDDYISKDKRSKQAIRELTAAFEDSVQHGLDEVNARNECLGGKLYVDL